MLDTVRNLDACSKAPRVREPTRLDGAEPSPYEIAAEMRDHVIREFPNNLDVTKLMTDMAGYPIAPWSMLQRLSRRTAPQTPEHWLATSPRQNLQSAPRMLPVLLRRAARYNDSGGRLDKSHVLRITRQTSAEVPSCTGQLINRGGGSVPGSASKPLYWRILTTTNWLTYHQVIVPAAPEYWV